MPGDLAQQRQNEMCCMTGSRAMRRAIYTLLGRATAAPAGRAITLGLRE